MTSRIATLSFFSSLAFGTCATLVACGGSSSQNAGGSGGDGAGAGEGGTNAGSAGVSGSGGSSSGSGGSSGSSTGGRGGAGASGASGAGGSATTGGTAGTTPTGGASGAGQGGQAGGGRECETAEDCVRMADCCDCKAVPVGSDVSPCPAVCAQDQCFMSGITPDDVTCAFGRCVIDRSCNHALATCDEMPQPCPDGKVRSLNESGCFGTCLAPTECRDVTDCASCGDAVCVVEEPQIRTFGCVDPGDSCTKGNYCDCLDACPPAGFVCIEADDGVHCPCPVC